MHEKQTLHDYVYHHLREQIISGQRPYGTKLPSMSQLCEFYHVGIRTVRDVLSRLKNEGYIVSEERKAAVVIYCQNDPLHQETAVHTILANQDNIREVYQTLAVVIPRLLAFSVQFYDDEDLKALVYKLTRLKNKSIEARTQICSYEFYRLLDRSHNLLSRDLFASLEIFTYITFFRNQPHFLDYILKHNAFHNIGWVLAPIAKKDQAAIIERSQTMFDSVAAAINDSIIDLKIENDEHQGQTKLYQWSANRGRDQYYTSIVRDLIDKIGTGYYKENNYLPPEAELAKLYGVSVATIRSALKVLNELGFAKTMNVKGTKVILQDTADTYRCMQHHTYRRDTLPYLSGLQLMTILIKPAARLAWDQIDTKTKAALSQQVKQGTAIPLALISECVIAHQPLQPLKEILRQVSQLLHWGYYYSFFAQGPASEQTLASRSWLAIEALQEKDAQQFAEALADCYCHVLDYVRDALVKCGLTAAAALITPDCSFY